MLLEELKGIGRMPLHIQLLDPHGKVLDQAKRN